MYYRMIGIRRSCKSHMWCVARFSTNLKYGEVLLLVKFTKSNTPPWVFFTFFKVYECYQIAQRTSYMCYSHQTWRIYICSRRLGNHTSKPYFCLSWYFFAENDWFFCHSFFELQFIKRQGLHFCLVYIWG